MTPNEYTELRRRGSRRVPRPQTAADLWHGTIDTISAFCDLERGSKTAILNEMNASHPPERGKDWNRQQFESYLNSDRQKRKEPRLGAGLVLMSAAFRVMEWSDNQKRFKK